MNNFGSYITPAEAKAHGDANGDKHPLSYWQEMADAEPGTCECGEPEWKYGLSGMCFSCTTGEADASDDCEIAP